MATTSTIKLKKDTTANWAANSTRVLANGECGVEQKIDGTIALKIGDGVKTWAELEYVADPTGVFNDMTVGNADVALVTKNIAPISEESGTIQSNPFISQGTGTNNNVDSVDTSPVAKQLEKQGYTVVNNQLYKVPADSSVTKNDVTIVGSLSANSITVDGTASASAGVEGTYRYYLTKALTIGHKCIAWLIPISGSVTHGKAKMKVYSFGSDIVVTRTPQIFTVGQVNPGVTPTRVDYIMYEGDSFSEYSFRMIIIDLTQYFNGNANIPADLLSNPSHWSWYDNGTGAYDAGTLKNANGRYLVCTGRNLFNGTFSKTGAYLNADGTYTGGQTGYNVTDYILVVPNRQYYFYKTPGSLPSLCFYDKDKNYIGGITNSELKNTYGRVATTPANCVYIRHSVQSSQCISLYYSAEQGGEGYDFDYAYEEPKVYDTGTEELLFLDTKDPDGTVHRNTSVNTPANIPQWNQLWVKDRVFASGSNNGITLTNNDDGSYTLNGTVTEGADYAQFVRYSAFSLTANHKYYVHFVDSHTGISGADGNGKFNGANHIISVAADLASATPYIRILPTAGTLTDYTVYCQLFDLTQIFGAGNEPTTVSQFKDIFPATYYEPKTGTANSNGAVKCNYKTADYINYQFTTTTPTTEQGTPFAENIEVNDYGMMYWLDTDDNLVSIPQGVKLFYPADYVLWTDTAVAYTDGDVTNLVLKGELDTGDPDTLKGVVDKIGVVAEQINAEIAEAYDSTQAYTAGDLLSYQNKIYECIDDAAAGTLPTNTTYFKEVSVAEKLDDLQTGKADTDGDYEGLTAGHSLLAENLDSNITIADKTPYSFRTTAGGEEVAGRCYAKSIVGADVVYNQLLQNGNFADDSEWTATSSTMSVSNNKATVTVVGSSGGIKHSIILSEGHKYMMNAQFTYTSEMPNIALQRSGTSRMWITAKRIFTPSHNDIDTLYIYSPAQKFTVQNIILIDLTQMFGSTIADYAYTISQGSGNQEKGYEWLFSYGFLTKSYYTYSTGSLLNVKASGKKVTGFNLYDNANGKAKLIGGKQCQITGTYTSLAYEDINGNADTITPDGNGKFTPANNGTLTVTGGSATDTCVHFVWDGERDGEYEPYEATTYACDDIDLHGFVLKDSNNNLFYDGDIYANDGTVTRKYAVLTGQTGAIGDTITLTGFDTSATDIITSAGHLADVGTISGDVLTLAKALSNATIVYPLATPTTESATAFTEYQKCDNWGTEEWLDGRTIEMPVGHDTDYLPDLKAKLETLPNNPDTDGYYVMKRDNGENTWYGLSSWLSENGYKASVIPDAPTTDGAYVLTVTMADGTATYTWESTT